MLTTFKNFTTFKNSECGILSERVGHTVYTDLKIADNRKCGFQSDKTNLTKEDVVIEHATIIGRSAFAADVANNVFNRARGIIAPKTDRVLFQNIDFFDFESNMTPL